MANKDQPRGAEPVGELLRVTEYVAGSACYPGDFVSIADDGKVDPAAGTAAVIGVALTYASAEDAKVLVSDHPDQRYRIQADGADINAQTDIGLNYDIVATAGSSAYKLSRQELDSDTGVATAATPLRLLGIDPRADNALGANVDCIVQINYNQLTNAGTGADGL